MIITIATSLLIFIFIFDVSTTFW